MPIHASLATDALLRFGRVATTNEVQKAAGSMRIPCERKGRQQRRPIRLNPPAAIQLSLQPPSQREGERGGAGRSASVMSTYYSGSQAGIVVKSHDKLSVFRAIHLSKTYREPR
jgi:hypothetical protein